MERIFVVSRVITHKHQNLTKLITAIQFQNKTKNLFYTPAMPHYHFSTKLNPATPVLPPETDHDENDEILDEYGIPRSVSLGQKKLNRDPNEYGTS